MKRLTDVGAPGNSKVVNGLVFRKNVVHKSMKSHILQPRVMLLGSMLEYHRTSGKLSSFDTLLEQASPFLLWVVGIEAALCSCNEPILCFLCLLLQLTPVVHLWLDSSALLHKLRFVQLLFPLCSAVVKPDT